MWTWTPSTLPEHPDYTILRILEWGDDEAVAWMRANLSEADIRGGSPDPENRRCVRKSVNSSWVLADGISPTDSVAALSNSRAK